MVVSYSNTYTGDNSSDDILWRRINGYSVEDLNDALYLLLVDLINGGWMED